VATLNGQGPVDFRATTIYTTLTPCVEGGQINNRCIFEKVGIGDITNAPSTAPTLDSTEGGIKNVTILEDAKANALYKIRATNFMQSSDRINILLIGVGIKNGMRQFCSWSGLRR